MMVKIYRCICVIMICLCYLLTSCQCKDDTPPPIPLRADTEIQLLGPLPMIGTPTDQQQQLLAQIFDRINTLSLSPHMHAAPQDLSLTETVTVDLIQEDITHTVMLALTHDGSCYLNWTQRSPQSAESTVVCQLLFDDETCRALIDELITTRA